MAAEIIIFDEPQTEVVRLSFAHITPSSTSKTPRMTVGHRYTDPIWYEGADSRKFTVAGVWIPPFTSVGAAWTTSSGSDPTQTIKKWKRLGTRLTYVSDVETLTSCNITKFTYKLVPGIPLTQVEYFSMEITSGVEP